MGNAVTPGGLTARLSQILGCSLHGISGLDPISYAGAMAILITIVPPAGWRGRAPIVYALTEGRLTLPH